MIATYRLSDDLLITVDLDLTLDQVKTINEEYAINSSIYRGHLIKKLTNGKFYIYMVSVSKKTFRVIDCYYSLWSARDCIDDYMKNAKLYRKVDITL